MALSRTTASMQQLMNKNQPSAQQQLMNPTSANLQQLTTNMQQMNTPTPTSMQQMTNPAPTTMQQLINPTPTNTMQQLNKPTPNTMQPLIKSTPGNIQQYLTNPAETHMQQLVNPVPTNIQQLMNDQTPTAKQQLIKQISISDDITFSKQIQAIPLPEGRKFNVRVLLNVVEAVFAHAYPTTDSLPLPALAIDGISENADTKYATDDNTNSLNEDTEYVMDDNTYRHSIVAVYESLKDVAHKIKNYKSGDEDAHATTMNILMLLSSYTWDAKLVIALAGFAETCGSFKLIAQNRTSNQLAEYMEILKILPHDLKDSTMLEKLRGVMLTIAKCIIDFYDLSSQYISVDFPAFSIAIAHFPLAVYWTIRSIMACESQINSHGGQKPDYMVSTTEDWELSSLAHKLSNIHSYLADQLGLCYEHIDERKQMETYQKLLLLFEMAPIDNMRVLKALIYAKDDIQPLVEGTTNRRVNLEVLWRKNVLLLISDLDNPQEEISILQQIYNESRLDPSRMESQYEIVWLPILGQAVPFNDTMLKKFKTLQSRMPWYSIYRPTLIDRAVIKFIKQEWNFNKKPILVVLDPRGRVACPNAFHMMWIWGTLAFPFSTIMEEALWKEESWRLELLVDAIDPIILNWMQEGRYICLYGGEDMEWIRKFTNAASAVAQAAGIPLEMVYVGKSNPKERIKMNTSTITAEKLSHCWQDLTSIWYFWIRIESMWRSKNQLGKNSNNDSIMKEIMTMLSFDSSEAGWAIFTRGTDDEMIKAKGSIFLTSLLDYTAWKDEIQQKGFLSSLRDYLKGLHTEHHCNRLILPRTARPERIVCSDCGRNMEKFLMYDV